MLPKLVLGLATLALMIPAAGSLGIAASDPVLADGVIPDEVVLGFHGPVPDGIDAWVEARGGQVLLRDDVLNWVSARLPDAAKADEAIASALQRPDVRFAHHDRRVSLLLTPNDPLYGSQWGFPAIRAPAAWDITRGSHAVKVAVLDTGIQITHPDLVANVCGPFTSYDGSGTIDDGHGHGTHVSGTIAAATNNGIGVAGMSDSCLMGAKVLGASGGGQWTWVAAGIRWAADNGAHIISMSLGGGDPGNVVHDAVKYAYQEKGVLIIAAAGNSGCGNPGLPMVGALTGDYGTGIWPANFPEVVSVAALVSPGTGPASFSSCGSAVEITAPGQSVLSTWRGSGYVTISGTSMATPHVSGVAALVKAQNPGITAVGLRCVLDLTAEDLGDLGRDNRNGWGRVNPVGALELDQALTAQDAHESFADACLTGAPLVFELPRVR